MASWSTSVWRSAAAAGSLWASTAWASTVEAGGKRKSVPHRHGYDQFDVNQARIAVSLNPKFGAAKALAQFGIPPTTFKTMKRSDNWILGPMGRNAVPEDVARQLQQEVKANTEHGLRLPLAKLADRAAELGAELFDRPVFRSSSASPSWVKKRVTAHQCIKTQRCNPIDAARAQAETPVKLLSLPRLLNTFYRHEWEGAHLLQPDFRFSGDRVLWADETDLPRVLPTLKSVVWHEKGTPPPHLKNLKCPHHTTLLLVYDANGHYYPPILVLSRTKTSEEKLGKKKPKFFNLRDATELNAAQAHDDATTSRRGRPSEKDQIWRSVPATLLDALPPNTTLLWTPNGSVTKAHWPDLYEKGVVPYMPPHSRSNPIIFGYDGASVHEEVTWKDRADERGEVTVQIASLTSARSQPNDDRTGPNRHLKSLFAKHAIKVMEKKIASGLIYMDIIDTMQAFAAAWQEMVTEGKGRSWAVSSFVNTGVYLFDANGKPRADETKMYQYLNKWGWKKTEDSNGNELWVQEGRGVSTAPFVRCDLIFIVQDEMRLQEAKEALQCWELEIGLRAEGSELTDEDRKDRALLQMAIELAKARAEKGAFSQRNAELGAQLAVANREKNGRIAWAEEQGRRAEAGSVRMDLARVTNSKEAREHNAHKRDADRRALEATAEKRQRTASATAERHRSVVLKPLTIHFSFF